jgi:hypothetical protein
VKPVKKQKRGNVWVPFFSRPTKKYFVSRSDPPRSRLRWIKARARAAQKHVGLVFRVGYYSWQDGLDCIWLVNEEGKYEQTIDHDFLAEYFEIVALSRERSLYGKNRVPLGAIK